MKLTIELITREFLQLMVNYHKLNAEFIPTPEGAKIGFMPEITDQNNVTIGEDAPWIEDKEFELSLDDFSKKWLCYFANGLGQKLKFSSIKKSYSLILPKTAAVERSTNAVLNGISCRGLLLYRIATDSWMLRFDVLYGK